MANDPQEKVFGAKVTRDDTPDGAQDVEGHAFTLNKDDSGIGETKATARRNDAPEGDDDVEGHARPL